MNLRFHIDSESGEPHIHSHAVDEIEVQDVLRQSLEEIRGRGASKIAIGQTRSGRYPRII